MSYPPPNSITNELEGEACWWAFDNAPCAAPAVTTYYDDFSRAWIPVCDNHRSGHYYARAAGHEVPSTPPQDGGESEALERS